MFKRLLIITLIMALCLPAAFARKKSKKAGEIKNNVYTDATFSFELTLLDNWERKMGKPKDMKRLDMIQKDHKIPGELMQFPQMAKTPKLEIFVSEEGENITPQMFIDSLVDMKYNSKVKKEIMSEILMLKERTSFDGFKQSQKNILKVNEKQAIQWIGSAEFTKDLGMGETISQSYGVACVAIKNGKQMLVFALTCEEMYLAEIYEELKKIYESVKWTE